MGEAALVVVGGLGLLQALHHIQRGQLRAIGEGGPLQGEYIGLQVLGDGEAFAQQGFYVIVTVRDKQALIEQGEDHPVVDVGTVVGVEALLGEIGQCHIGGGGMQAAGGHHRRLRGLGGPGHVRQAVAGGNIGRFRSAARQDRHQHHRCQKQ